MEYTAFLLLHAAHVDLEYTPNERIRILELISEAQLSEFEALYANHTDSSILEALRNHADEFFPSQTDHENLIAIIKDFFNADGDYSKLESNLLDFLNHLFQWN